MKLQGKSISPLKPVIIPIVRNSDDPADNLYFSASVVIDYADFEKLAPAPKPPQIIRPGGARSVNVEDPTYKKNIHEWNMLRTHWMILKSLAATPGLEWNKVKLDDPATWHLYEEEMREDGMSDSEIGRVINGILEANGLDDAKVDAARKAFLASLPAPV